jgi:FixJ family two-component response regulator
MAHGTMVYYRHIHETRRIPKMAMRPLIAVVDDEESIRLALARLLRASSYEVSTYASGQEFLTSLQTSRPQCVLLDFQMPDMTGRDVQRALTLAKVSLPVIIVTAYDQPSLREKCLADGAAGYFSKPLRREPLIAAIDAAIDAAGQRGGGADDGGDAGG